MTDRREAALKRKLDEIAKLTREADAEAKEIYGADAFVFAEADGGLHVMDGDKESGVITARPAERQDHIRLSATKSHALGVGAW